MIKLNDKDLELLGTGGTVDLSLKGNAYLGGEFGNNVNDYIQASIYDINDNFLESGIVHTDDWDVDNANKIKLKTGTILRKMGYDRGKFKVKYHFLRKTAGSWETILVDDTGTVYTDEFNPSTDAGRIGQDLFLKENKYFIHEISPTRTEVRLVPQNIKYDKYIRDFEVAQTTSTTIGGGQGKQFGPIEFSHDDPDADLRTSTTIKLVNEEERFPPNIQTNGKLVIPQAFIQSHTPPDPEYDPDSATFTLEEVDSEIMQARFYLEQLLTGTEGRLNDGYASPDWGDKTYGLYYQNFKEFNTVDTALNGEFGTVHEDQNGTMKDIKSLPWTQYKTPTFQTYGSEGESTKTATVRLKSNSFLPFASPRTYTWTITGFDRDTGGGNTTAGYATITNNVDGVESYYDGNVYIVPTVGAAQPSQTSNPAGLVAVDEDVFGDAGSYLDLKLISGDLRVGIMLTVSNNAGQNSTIHFPVCLRTIWREN